MAVQIIDQKIMKLEFCIPEFRRFIREDKICLWNAFSWKLKGKHPNGRWKRLQFLTYWKRMSLWRSVILPSTITIGLWAQVNLFYIECCLDCWSPNWNWEWKWAVLLSKLGQILIRPSISQHPERALSSLSKIKNNTWEISA